MSNEAVWVLFLFGYSIASAVALGWVAFEAKAHDGPKGLIYAILSMINACTAAAVITALAMSVFPNR